MLGDTEIALRGDVGEDAVRACLQSKRPVPHLPDTCAALMELAVQRNAMIRGQQRLELAAQSMTARALGWQPTLPEAKRKKIRAKAERIVRQVAKGKTPEDAEAARLVGDEVQALMEAKQPLTARRALQEKTMQRLAKQTPGMTLVEQVRGFGPLGLASILGEAGDLSDYPHWKHLRKRLGWAPDAAYPRACDVHEDSSSESRLVPRQRRGRIYGDVLIPLIMANPAGAETPYRAAYDTAKAEYLERGWKKGHASNAAQRRMLQLLLKHLWQTWKESAA